jgi:hypothetical protein
MTKKLLLYLFFSCFSFSYSQNIKLSETSKVSIFTCGRGEELYSTFGHTALRIKDSINQLDLVYNYGAFDFRIDNFYLKFVKGDLQYFMNVSSFDEFIYEYQYDNREVVEQTLNFNLSQKQSLFEKLNNNYASAEKYYTYKFIDRNCTSMVVDKINETIGKPLIQKVDDKTITYREVLYPYFENYFWYKLGINIIFGAKTDAKAQKLFLPIELLNSLDKCKVNGIPLVTAKQTLLNGAELKHSFSFINSIYLVILILFLLYITNNIYIHKIYLFLLGLLGLFLCLVGFYSYHQEILWNYNALLFNPLYIIIPFLKGKKLKNIIAICGIMLILYVAVIFTKPYVILMIPFIIMNGILLYKFYKNKLLTSVK